MLLQFLVNWSNTFERRIMILIASVKTWYIIFITTETTGCGYSK